MTRLKRAVMLGVIGFVGSLGGAAVGVLSPRAEARPGNCLCTGSFECPSTLATTYYSYPGCLSPTRKVAQLDCQDACPTACVETPISC